MGSRYRKQEEIRLELTGGDWLLVRKHLTMGEERDAQIKVMKAPKPGATPELDLEHLGIAQVYAYLLDWSITDENDHPIRVRDQPYAFVAAALRNQTPESFKEILEAIQTHEAAMIEARDLEKKGLAGANV